MKTLTAILIPVALIFGGCVAGNVSNPSTVGDNVIQEDPQEEEYDIIIDDPAFHTWLTVNGYPEQFHTNNYYRQKNNVLVSEWNSRFYARGGRYPYNFNIVNYDFQTDYGFNVNYKLYHYFRYLHAKYGVILPGV